MAIPAIWARQRLSYKQVYNKGQYILLERKLWIIILNKFASQRVLIGYTFISFLQNSMWYLRINYKKVYVHNIVTISKLNICSFYSPSWTSNNKAQEEYTLFNKTERTAFVLDNFHLLMASKQNKKIINDNALKDWWL